MLGSLQIVVSEHAYRVINGERKFPASKHRSRRILKKLIKRHGGEYHLIHEPLAYQIGNQFIVHPKIYEEMKRRVKAQDRSQPYAR